MDLRDRRRGDQAVRALDNARHRDDSRGALQAPPYYQKTTFRPIHVVSLNHERVIFTLRSNGAQARVMLFKDIHGTARGTIRLNGMQHRVECSRG